MSPWMTRGSASGTASLGRESAPNSMTAIERSNPLTVAHDIPTAAWENAGVEEVLAVKIALHDLDVSEQGVILGTPSTMFSPPALYPNPRAGSTSMW